ncbi:MAG: VWA domain-containing protein [Hyphomicrobiaceae bacterium]
MPDKSKRSGEKPSAARAPKPENVSAATVRAGGALDPRSGNAPATAASDAEVADFVARIRSLSSAGKAGRGRLIFAMDATMSRQPTWDLALGLQADMFRAVKEVGGLDVQLVYFRGAGECRSSKWVSDPEALARLMTSVGCMGGHTQIGKVLGHVRQEAEAGHVSAVVYVGDAMEENIDDLAQSAGEVALFGVPVFVFQEGHERTAQVAFKEIARLTRGAYCHFDAGSARQLRELLSAVAVYAAGGRSALERLAHEKNGSGARLLISQMR